MIPIIVKDNLLVAIHAMLSMDNPTMTQDNLQAIFAGQQSGESLASIPKVYTRAETAEIFKVHISTIDRWLAEKTMISSHVNGTVRISSSEINRLLLPKKS